MFRLSHARLLSSLLKIVAISSSTLMSQYRGKELSSVSHRIPPLQEVQHSNKTNMFSFILLLGDLNITGFAPLCEDGAIWGVGCLSNGVEDCISPGLRSA